MPCRHGRAGAASHPKPDGPRDRHAARNGRDFLYLDRIIERMTARLTPCKRDDFIDALRLLGFEGPFAGSRHQFVQYQDYPLHIPSYDEYDVPKLKEMIREVEHLIDHPVSNQDWASIKSGRRPPWLPG